MAVSQRSILGLVAVAAATFLLFIFLCVNGVNHGSKVMVLLGFLAGGLCTIIRLVNVLSSNGMMTMGFLNDNKKLVAMLIVGTGIIAGGFTFIAFIWITVNIAEFNSSSLSDWGYSITGTFYFTYVCVILAGVAGLANVVLGFLEVRDSGAPPAPAS